MPYTGHVNPMQPIAKELVSRGHDVLWLTGKRMEAQVSITGARFAEMASDAMMKDDEIKPPESSGMTAALSYMQSMFLDRVPAQVRDYQAVLQRFPADVLIVEFCTFGAFCLRDLTGLPYATLGINPLVTADPEIPPWGTGAQPPATFIGRMMNSFSHFMATKLFFTKLTAALNERREELHLQPLASADAFNTAVRSDALHIMMTTEMFEFPRAALHPAVKFVGPLMPIVDDKDFVEPDWWGEMVNRPRQTVVHVTQGTVVDDSINLIRPTIEALSSCSDLLVIATGKELQAQYSGEQRSLDKPANLRLAAFVPHAKLLPHVGVMVTNAGYNGVLAALSCGVPLVCAGRTEDKADVSSRVTYAGAGVDLATDTPSMQAIRDAVRKVLAEQSFTDTARRIMEDFARHNGPAEAADALEELQRNSKATGDYSRVGAVQEKHNAT